MYKSRVAHIATDTAWFDEGSWRVRCQFQGLLDKAGSGVPFRPLKFPVKHVRTKHVRRVDSGERETNIMLMLAVPVPNELFSNTFRGLSLIHI